MPKARLVFDGDNLYTEKEARIYKLKQEISTKIDAIPGVVDDLNSTSTTDALSANMGRELQDQINSLRGNFHFLSTWDCLTGLPGTDPQEDPYTYESGDYYIVSTVATETYEHNLKPHGSSYTQGVPSTEVETGTVDVNDWYVYDGAVWVLQPAGNISIVVDSQMDATSVNPVQNRVITQALAGKQDTISDLNTIRSGASAGATALQPNTNITQLTNNAGYQTSGEVNSAIQTAIAGIESNTKTFFLSGTSDLTNAQAAYDWIESGKNAIINHSGVSYILSSSGAHSMGFDSASKTYSMSPTDGYVVPKVKHMRFFLNNGVVTQISIQGEDWHGYIPVSGILGDGFTPTANAHPATKKYVDDNDTKIASVAPSNPTEGMLWYDTTNDVLKTYDGSQWNSVGGGGATYTAGSGISIDANNEISVDTTVVATQTDLTSKADDSGVVHNTGDETIAGVKTFSSSPIVPTPTNNTDAATKKYVDDAVSQAGGGDMLSSVYDPNNVGADVYDYNNFIHTPTIGIGLLTLQKNGTQVAQFNANSTANVTANITVPTTVAELSDASDYVTDSELTADLADYVEGPSTAINGNIAVFDGTTGKLIADSGLKIQVTASRPSGLYCDVYYNNGMIYLYTGGVEPNNLSSESGDNLITEGGDNIILEY